MSKASEEITKGLTSDILRDIIDYPSNQTLKLMGLLGSKKIVIMEQIYLDSKNPLQILCRG